MIKIISVRSKELIKVGLAKNISVVSINGFKVSDQFDVNFYSDDDELILEILDKGGVKKKVKISSDKINDIQFEPLKPKRCGANCIFCFIEQLPKGLRKSLYHKDEDYRFSYMYGNYVAMANINKSDLEKIAMYKLSPLYISVHTTEPKLRGKILGLKKTAPILPYIRFLASNRIFMHCQIVLCPDINDGEKLNKTIFDLAKYYPYVSTVAIVPVGLTVHRKDKFPLKLFEKKRALKLINQARQLQRVFLKRYGNPFIYLSDEFYLLAGRSLPEADFYGEFSQVENGVGITRQLIDDAEKLLNRKLGKGNTNKRIAVITGMLAYKTVLPYIDKLSKKTGLDISLYPIENSLFGKSVTVTGLITGRDIMKSLREKFFDALFIPNVMLKDKKNTFLDDVTVTDLKRYFQCNVYQFSPSLSNLYKKLIKSEFITFDKG